MGVFRSVCLRHSPSWLKLRRRGKIDERVNEVVGWSELRNQSWYVLKGGLRLKRSGKTKAA